MEDDRLAATRRLESQQGVDLRQRTQQVLIQRAPLVEAPPFLLDFTLSTLSTA